MIFKWTTEFGFQVGYVIVIFALCPRIFHFYDDSRVREVGFRPTVASVLTESPDIQPVMSYCFPYKNTPIFIKAIRTCGKTQSVQNLHGLARWTGKLKMSKRK